MIAETLVDVPSRDVDRTFDYLVPDHLVDVIEIGQRVKVPFGPRFIMGYVLGIKDDTDIERLKQIRGVMDIVPSLTPELIELGRTIAMANTSPLVSIYQAMLPAALKANYKRVLRCHDTSTLPLDVAMLFNKYGEAPYDNRFDSHLKTVKAAVADGRVDIVHRIRQKNVAQYRKRIRLVDATIPVRGAKQQAVIDDLRDADGADKHELMARLEVSHSTIRSLIDKGIIAEEAIEFYREVDHIYAANNKRVTFNDEQQQVYDAITATADHHRTHLIHGVTGSGKTELYLNLIEDVVANGKEAIMLVPEISLTPMMVSRFKGRFGDNVALLHSRLSIGEKYDEWRKVRRREVQVVVGARSAIFAPFENLGVIIIDEEHTDSYKQDTPPMYHAKDVAQLRAEHYDIPLVLGSATPSVDSFYKAQRGVYDLHTIRHRANRTTLPDVFIEDMRYEFQGGNRSIFSRRLEGLIEDRLNKGEQTMLLLNRRGHSTFVMCRSCGEVVMCPNCDISLTYHERTGALECHYCGHKEASPSTCPSCDSPHIRYMGIGTEKVESHVRKRWPTARVIRMDTDTTTFKNAHETLLHEFETNGDILIGTQMIAKGLDFPHVTLVGVLAADMSLNLPDYKAIEKTFQLLTQVSGRAGRHDIEGQVVIQTYHPDHYAIRYAKDHDYLAFYETEMKIRELSGYTPFYQLVQIIVSDKDVKRVLKEGTKIVLTLRKELAGDVTVLGPVLPKIARVNNYYRAQIIIKYRTSDNIDRVLKQIHSTYHEAIGIAIDKNPTLL